MAWDARSVDDYTLHRRRFLFACCGFLAELIVLTGVQLSEPVSAKQLVTGLSALAVLAYLAYMAFHEWRGMKAAAR
jgi:hypothetical protein